jgi:glyoxylate carboligase
MPKGSDLLVAALENEGVDRIFGVPGEENLDVVESLRNSSIKLILTRHEQGAAFMAATYGRLIVVVPIDYTENSRVLIDELREKLEKVAEPVA